MKMNHTLALLQTGYTTVEICFAPFDTNETLRKTHTYKSFFLDLQEGDFVVVPANAYSKAMQVCKVVAVHVEPKIDLDANFEYAWLVAKVDIIDYEKVLENEAYQKETLQKLQTQRVRAEALEGLKALYGDDIQSLECDVTK